jgi:hypothetical protein
MFAASSELPIAVGPYGMRTSAREAHMVIFKALAMS